MSRDDAYLLDMLRFAREVIEMSNPELLQALERLVPPEEKA
jgi:hypothetical protein